MGDNDMRKGKGDDNISKKPDPAQPVPPKKDQKPQVPPQVPADKKDVKPQAPVQPQPDKKDSRPQTPPPPKAEKKDMKAAAPVQPKAKPEGNRVRFVNKKVMWMTVGVIVVVFVFFKAVTNLKNALFKSKKKTIAMETVGEAVPVKVYKIKRMDYKDTLPLLGTLRGYKEVPLKFQVAGVLESFNFEEGESIQEGDIIANLEQKDALLKLKYAELEMNAQKKILDAGGITKDAYEKTRLEYESAKSDLEKTNIYAVSDGMLGTQDMDVGSYVTQNDKVGIFVDITRVYAEFEVIEKDSPKLRLGLKCELYVDALPSKTFVGTLDVISPIVEGRTRTQKVKVELKNEGNLLKPGMFVRGLVSVYEKKNAIIIPSSALKKTESGYVVFVVNKEETPDNKKEDKGKDKNAAPETESNTLGSESEFGTVEVRPVQIAHMGLDRVEIEDSLEDGDMIVIELYQELKDKEKVEIAEVQEILY